jgi:allophanate hydrolase
MELTTADLTLPSLREAYAAGGATPTSVATRLVARIQASHAVFITKPRLGEVLERCRELEAQPAEARGPLWGVPFAVKDNVDVAGMPTTCACPDFSYVPEASAPAVVALLAAGGVCLGKTNLDQFACGLVGARTPYGICANTFDDRFTPGGSSGGSAVAVAGALVCFALGTDTAGSGRVPAGLNGIVGVKPSLGRFSTTGVVPACFSLDCLSVFALSVEDGAEVARLMECSDIGDPTWRPRAEARLAQTYARGQPFRFAVPSPEFLDFSGPGGAPVRREMDAAFADAVERLQAIGGERVELDFAPFAETAQLLYGAAFVAERYSGIRAFLEARAPGLEPPELADLSIDQRLLKVTRSVIAKTENWSAADVFEGLQALASLRAAARVQLARVDVLVVPTAAYNYTVREIMAEEDEQDYQAMLSGKTMISKNANLGRFTNFVNLLDMCGVSVPSGLLRLGEPPRAPSPASPARDSSSPSLARHSSFRGAGARLAAAEAAHAAGPAAERADHLAATGSSAAVVPFGITVLAPAWTDEYVAGVAAAYLEATGLRAGPAGHGVAPYRMVGTVRPRKSGAAGAAARH